MRRSFLVIGLLSVCVAVHGEDPGSRAQALGFVKLLGDKDLGGVAESSLKAMGADAVPALSFVLKDLASGHRGKAAELLGAIGGENAQSALRSAVGERDASVRVAACHALVKLGDRWDKVIGGLASALSVKSDAVRRMAADALKTAGKDGEAAMPALMAALEDRDPAVREQARAALSNMGVVTIDRLRAGTKSDSPILRTMAVRAIAGIGADAKDAVPGLIELLGETRLQEDAAKALGAIGKDAAAAAPELERILVTPTTHPDARKAALLALDKIQHDGWNTTEALKQLWGARDPRVRAFAADQLGMRREKSVVPNLMAGTNDMSHLVRESSAMALARIAPESNDLMALLMGALDNKLFLSRDAAARVLGFLGPKAAGAKDKLQDVLNEALENENDGLVAAVRAALDAIG